jgi:hypothetical protein
MASEWQSVERAQQTVNSGLEPAAPGQTVLQDAAAGLWDDPERALQTARAAP